MSRVLLMLYVACTAALAALAGCAAQPGAPTFEQRFALETAGLAASLQATTLGLTSGQIPRDKAAKALADSQLALLGLQTARSVEAPGVSATLDGELAAVVAAQSGLQAALAQGK
jgi:uncharacterized lipoprotein YajG